MKTDREHTHWTKSSYSNGDGACVEVAHLGRAVAVRDSKQGDGPILTSSVEGWNAFVKSVIADDL